LQQIEGPNAIVGPVGLVAGHGAELRVPLVFGLFLQQGDLLPGPGTLQLRLANRLRHARELRRRRVGADVDDAIHAPFGAASAGDEVQPAVGSDRHVGHGQRPAADEDLAVAGVAAP
jgi:hypothetical protein